ncbi:MAG: UDP-glucose/GDP-mannose dehydrogenase family protein, partial [Candidatus Woesearchaeota archaeon]
MHTRVVERIIKALVKQKKSIAGSKVLVMGLSFKENVNDYRNSRAKQLIAELQSYDFVVEGYDPLLSPSILEKEFKAKPVAIPKGPYSCVILFSPHRMFLQDKRIWEQWAKGAVLMDIKGALDKKTCLQAGCIYLRL